MSSDAVHPSALSTNTKPHLHRETACDDRDHVDDPSLPPQRHAGAVGLGPNYPLGPSVGDKLGGVAEEFKGKVLGKPEVVAHGRERRTGALMRKARERDEAAGPFQAPLAEGQNGARGERSL
ncbi:hypothetical protein V8E55_008394 [Tylopilus felleus]